MSPVVWLIATPCGLLNVPPRAGSPDWPPKKPTTPFEASAGDARARSPTTQTAQTAPPPARTHLDHAASACESPLIQLPPVLFPVAPGWTQRRPAGRVIPKGMSLETACRTGTET